MFCVAQTDTLQHTATLCNTHCNPMQHTATRFKTHFNTPPLLDRLLPPLLCTLLPASPPTTDTPHDLVPSLCVELCSVLMSGNGRSCEFEKRRWGASSCCSVLQCGAVCCSVWQCVAFARRLEQRIWLLGSALQCVSVCCSAHAHMQTYTHIHKRTHIHTHTRTCKYTHIHTYAHTHTCTNTHAHTTHTCMYVYIPMEF